MDRHNELQQHKTAVEYRQAADEHVRTLKDFWKDFLVSGLFVLAAIVAIFACLAWFAANNRVSATGSTIGAKAARYSLTATGEGEPDAHTGYYERTDAEKQNITRLDTTDAMTVTLGSNLNNESAGSLYPGARGKITFTVKPLVDDLNGVTINLLRVLKVTGNVVVEDGKTLTSDAQTLLGLVKGHLLFFTKCDNGYYSDRVINNQITIPKSKFCEDGKTTNPTKKSVPVTLYWVWPEYFQNFVLTGNTNYYKNLFAAAGDAKSDYGALQADMNAHKANYFYGAANGTSAANAPAVSADISFGDTAICSALYNNADEQIGNKVKYIQLRISAQEGVSS
ncbi:MAG: hypothetical protein U0J28_00650 [Collinsella sp.]|nr:hypothetical protein [Collinsella sp.]